MTSSNKHPIDRLLLIELQLPIAVVGYYHRPVAVSTQRYMVYIECLGTPAALLAGKDTSIFFEW
ncbi:MAG: hypothetical protein OXD43_08815 [Bacteroidetes bacterium]|nr:hypothetical protein [Bacteroidota bacterium]